MLHYGSQFLNTKVDISDSTANCIMGNVISQCGLDPHRRVSSFFWSSELGKESTTISFWVPPPTRRSAASHRCGSVLDTLSALSFWLFLSVTVSLVWRTHVLIKGVNVSAFQEHLCCLLISVLTHAVPLQRNFLFTASCAPVFPDWEPGLWALTLWPRRGRGVDAEKMRCTTLLALLIGVMLYLVMGALVFGTLELPQENLAFEDLLATKNTFLDNNSCVTERDFYDLVKVSLDPLSTLVTWSLWLFCFCSFDLTWDTTHECPCFISNIHHW